MKKTCETCKHCKSLHILDCNQLRTEEWEGEVASGFACTQLEDDEHILFIAGVEPNQTVCKKWKAKEIMCKNCEYYSAYHKRFGTCLRADKFAWADEGCIWGFARKETEGK